jgi:hypothetical protein
MNTNGERAQDKVFVAHYPSKHTEKLQSLLMAVAYIQAEYLLNKNRTILFA